MSHFCCTHHPDKVKVEKARKRPNWSKTRNPERLEALSKRMGSAINLDLIHGITKFKKRINPQAIYDAWKSGNWESALHKIPWDRLEEDLGPAKNRLEQGMTGFGRIGIDVLAKPQQKLLRYDYKNPAIQRVFDKRAGEWIVGIEHDTRDSIKAIVHQQMTHGVSPRDMAHQIKNYVGLYPRLAQAHSNYVTGLVKQGMSPDKVQVLSDRYYNKLLAYRTKTIARTETQTMLNRGQLEVWKEGARQGLLPAQSKKVWVVDGNPCEICEAMDGVAVLLNDSWILPDGSEVDIPTEAHPNCECIMTIEMGDGSEEDAD